MYNNYPR